MGLRPNQLFREWDDDDLCPGTGRPLVPSPVYRVLYCPECGATKEQMGQRDDKKTARAHASRLEFMR